MCVCSLDSLPLHSASPSIYQASTPEIQPLGRSEEPRPHPEELHASWHPHPSGVKAAGTQQRDGRWVGARREVRGPRSQQGRRCVTPEVAEMARCREVNPQPSSTGRGEERFPLAMVTGLPPFGSAAGSETAGAWEVGRRRRVRGSWGGEKVVKSYGGKRKSCSLRELILTALKGFKQGCFSSLSWNFFLTPFKSKSIIKC